MICDYSKKGLAYEKGYEILKEKGMAIVGFSLDNSYFKKDTIDQLIRYIANNFSNTKIMIADKSAVHNYKAKGYNQEKAERKSRLKGNALRNHANRTIDDLTKDVSLVNWERIEQTNEYKQSYQEIISLYNTNKEFYQDTRNTTKEVLKTKKKESIDEGVQYLLEELSFIIASPRIYDNKIAYVYHREWLIFENLIAGKYKLKVENLGFMIVK